MINADFILWAAPLKMGFPAALLKMANDKHLPLIHPYMVVDQGEAHHLKRYARYPRLGLLVEKEADTDERDLQIVSDIYLPDGAQLQDPPGVLPDNRNTRRRDRCTASPPGMPARCRCPGACRDQGRDHYPALPADALQRLAAWPARQHAHLAGEFAKGFGGESRCTT